MIILMIFQRRTDGDKWADYSFPGYVYTVGQVFYKKSLSRKGYRLFLSLRVFHGNMFLLNPDAGLQDYIELPTNCSLARGVMPQSLLYIFDSRYRGKELETGKKAFVVFGRDPDLQTTSGTSITSPFSSCQICSYYLSIFRLNISHTSENLELLAANSGC